MWAPLELDWIKRLTIKANKDNYKVIRKEKEPEIASYNRNMGAWQGCQN